jgi:CheY-like chemotaxis protein
MDIRMPVMDGHEATRQIRATSEGQDTVIIALTATAFEEDRQETLSEGCDDFVRKPFREEEIFDRLARHLGVRFVYQNVEPPARAEPPVLPKELIATLKGALSPGVLEALPAGWVDELHQAAVQADADLALDLAAQIRAQHAPIADALTSLIQRYRFDMIVSFIQEIGDSVCKTR